MGQLAAEQIKNSNLESVWADVLAERRDTDAIRTRRLEALLGYDPDEADPTVLERLVQDSKDLGEEAITELTADYPGLTSAELAGYARERGAEANPQNAVKLPRDILLKVTPGKPAWVRGAETAAALRKHEHLGDSTIDDDTLCHPAGVATSLLK